MFWTFHLTGGEGEGRSMLSIFFWFILSKYVLDSECSRQKVNAARMMIRASIDVHLTKERKKINTNVTNPAKLKKNKEKKNNL